MNRKGANKVWVIGGIVLFIVLIGVMFYYFAGGFRSSSVETVVLQNPTEGLTLAQAIEVFDEEFVLYLLASIGAGELHNPPLSGNKPKIEMYVGEEIYNAVIDRGAISVGRGTIGEKDVIIRTTTEEAVYMIQDRDYIEDSFMGGKSSVELVEAKSTLFAKGYLGLYKDLTGKGITGGVIGVYTE